MGQALIYVQYRVESGEWRRPNQSLLSIMRSRRHRFSLLGRFPNCFSARRLYSCETSAAHESSVLTEERMDLKEKGNEEGSHCSSPRPLQKLEESHSDHDMIHGAEKPHLPDMKFEKDDLEKLGCVSFSFSFPSLYGRGLIIWSWVGGCCGCSAEAELMKEIFSKVLLGEDMSGRGSGICTALALSKVITNLNGMA